MEYKDLPEYQQNERIERTKNMGNRGEDKTDNILITRYPNGTVSADIPIGSPDQETTNIIWSMATGALITIGTVYGTCKLLVECKK